MKACKRRLTDDEIIELYLVKLKTMAEIGALAGVSKQSIYLVLQANNIAYRGGKVKKHCLYCQLPFMVQRKRVKRGQGEYCSVKCFASSRSLGGDTSIHSRLGRAMLLSAGVKLDHGAVVHHIDGDRNNNKINNLQVFSSQKEHMQFHHSLRFKND